MELGFEIQKTNFGIRIRILDIPCVPIFRHSGQIWLYWSKFTQKLVFGLKFFKKICWNKNQHPRDTMRANFQTKRTILSFFSPLMYNHITFSQLYYKYLQNLQRLHAKYAQSAKTTELNLRNTARKTLDKNAMLALSPKPNTFVCWLGNDNNKESIRR